MDRRDFFRRSAAGIMCLALPGRKTALMATERGGDGYSVVILGDTHYDSADPELYHAGYTDPNPQREALHRKEFVRNGQMWDGRCKELVKRAACLVDDDTAFVLQTGDLIQGDTADAATHTRFLEDAMNLFKTDLAPDLPFVTVAGNHDLRGNDDAVVSKAYADYMPARLSRELGTEITGTDFIFRRGPDAYIGINFTKPDVARIEKLLRESDGARHVFVAIHSPVFPFDDAKYYWWYLLGNRKDSRSEERRYVRRLMAERNAVVLCGHTHTTELLDWYGDGGRITQMTMSSVWSNEALANYKESASGAESYGTLLFKKNPDLATEANIALFDEYRSGIRRYSMAYAAGSYKMLVDDGGITVDFYGGSSARRSKRFKLR